MAKIVILSAPAFGHLNPVLPVIAELVQRGHDVVVLNQAELAPLVERQGGRFIAYPEALSLADLTRAIASGNLIALFELLLDATDALLPRILTRPAAEPAAGTRLARAPVPGSAPRAGRPAPDPAGRRSARRPGTSRSAAVGRRFVRFRGHRAWGRGRERGLPHQVPTAPGSGPVGIRD